MIINVTKVFLPPKEELYPYFDGIYSRHWVTNNGPLVNELEQKLKAYLNLPHTLFLNNGTVAIQIAIKALELHGEIITTPFSYVATTSSIVWEQCSPVFVDIDPHTLNIDPAQIEAAITSETSAILATHVFGNPCNVHAIESIARKHGLKVIYDAAHCFGTEFQHRSLFDYGDVSTVSFHATKLFHTVEGGAIFSSDDQLNRKMSLLRNFGHTSPVTFEGAGINAKNSEFHAAMGLAVLPHIDAIMLRRKQQWLHYEHQLQHSGLQLLSITSGTTRYNYSYFPVIFASERDLLAAQDALNLQYVYPRRYFYPALNTLDYVRYSSCPVAESVAARVLCLPLYHDLSLPEQDMIVRTLIKSLKS